MFLFSPLLKKTEQTIAASNFSAHSLPGPSTYHIYRNVTAPVYTMLKGVRNAFSIFLLFNKQKGLRGKANENRCTEHGTGMKVVLWSFEI